MKLFIETGNSAFFDYPLNAELTRILSEVATRLERLPDSACVHEQKLCDVNGNVVGWVNPQAQRVCPAEDVFTLQIDTGNAAFEDAGLGHELAAVIQRAIHLLLRGETSFDVRDTNGNVVGHGHVIAEAEVSSESDHDHGLLDQAGDERPTN